MAWADGTITPRTMSQLEAAVRTDFGIKLVSDYLAIGSGSDESTLIQNAVNAAIVTGKRLSLKRDKTYVVGTSITVNGPMRLEGNGATLKKNTALNDYALKLTGVDVEVVDLNVDGNRAGGNANSVGCVSFTGGRGIARRLKAFNSKVVGIFTSNTLDCYDCEGSDIVTTATTGDGFQVGGAAGVLRTYGNCRANNNGHCGFHCSASSADGCRIEGSAENNNFCGAFLLSDKGYMPRLYTRNNGVYGVYGQSASDWSIGALVDEDSGKALNGEYTVNPAATSVEFLACSRFDIVSITSRRPLGYGLALSQLSGVGCTYFTVGRVYVDGPGDPGCFIGGGSSFNTIDTLIVISDVALSFSEGIAGSNDHNVINFIHAISCSYVAVRGSNVNHLKIGRVVCTDCWNRTGYTGFVQWQGTNASYNSIGSLEASNYGTPPSGAALPTCIMSCDLGALHNWIRGGFSRQVSTMLADPNPAGSNRVDFVTPP